VVAPAGEIEAGNELQIGARHALTLREPRVRLHTSVAVRVGIPRVSLTEERRKP
jgi:hypothetical protein